MNAETVVSKTDLSVWLGVGERRIEQLTNDRTLKANGGNYALRSSILVYCKFLRSANRRKTADSPTMADAKLDLTNQQARERKLKADKLEGLLIERETVEREFVQLGVEYRALWQALPARLSRELGLSSEQATALQAAIDETLSDFAASRPPSAPEPAPVDIMALY